MKIFNIREVIRVVKGLFVNRDLSWRLAGNVPQAGPVRIFETSSVYLPKRFYEDTKLY